MGDTDTGVWGANLILKPENFGGDADEASVSEDRFASRQDVIHRLNTALAGADAEASQSMALRMAAPDASDIDGAPDFSDQVRDLLRTRHAQALSGLSDPLGRDETDAGFDGLFQRHMGRAVQLDLDTRAQRRAAGAEQALAQIKAAAVADPDGLADRLADSQLLLGRMVEAGVDPHAAALRARSFRAEVGQAVFDDLAERDPLGAVARLDNGLFDAVVPKDDRRPIRDTFVQLASADEQAARRRAEIGAREADFDSAARRRSTVIALTGAIGSGDADDGTIARALYRGEIDADDANELRTNLEASDADRLQRAAEIDRFDTAVKSGIIGDASFTWSPHVVDAWWQNEQARGIAQPSLIANSHDISGQIPESYIDDLRTRLLSDRPENVVSAAQEYQTLRSASPGAANAVTAALPDSEARQLAALADYAHLDLSATRILDLASKVQDEVDRHLPNYANGGIHAPQSGSLKINPPPTSQSPVNLDAYYKMLDYSEDGDSEMWNAFAHIPWAELTRARATGADGIADAARAARDYGLSYWDTDAFRHAKWAYTLSIMLGPDVAKLVGDAHERSAPDAPKGESLMDLYNNHVGRQIFLESHGVPNVDVDQLILDALRSNRLQRQPFIVRTRNQ